MGWVAYYKDGTIKSEDKDGRPVQDGEEGSLSCIIQEDFGHKVAIDLIGGAIIIDYDRFDFQNGKGYVENPRTVLMVCQETNILGDLVDVKRKRGRPTKEGWVKQDIIPIQFRPIWFTRMTNGVPTKVIGIQTTMPKIFGGKNVKKLVSIFADGRLGID